ncbi:MAG: hypothetical protein ACJ77E_10935 [Gaiellaceae bacterium]
MTASVATCRDCDRPRKPGAIFCECGALLDYSATNGGAPVAAAPNVNVAPVSSNGAAPATATKDLEWPPGPYAPMTEPGARSPVSMRVVRCRNERCQAFNPTTLVFCWKCGTPIAEGVEATPTRSLRRTLRLEKPPLRAGERAYPRKPFLGADPRTLVRAGLIAAAALLVAAALAIGAVKAWGPAWAHAARAYGVTREAVFPRYSPVHPSSVYPPRTTNPTHPAADAFDRNLSTYWQSTTPREVPDLIRVYFKPLAKQIDEVAVFAGDPTATTIVPRTIQMTFYRWEPHPSQHLDQCKPRLHLPHFPIRPTYQEGAFCVMGIANQFQLLNTPTEQRFATGDRRNVAKVVITIRGVHRTDNPKAKAALTDVEFFDKH